MTELYETWSLNIAEPEITTRFQMNEIPPQLWM